MSGPRTDFAFPRAIEAELLAAGCPAEVRNTAMLGTPTKDIFRTWEQDVLQWSPDVIVIIAGHYETIHLFLPHWFERYANRPDRRPGGSRGHRVRRVVRAVWKLLATLQSKVDGPLGARILRRRLLRVASDLEGYLDLVQQVASPLVFVLELLPPSGNKHTWFPGMSERIAFMNEQIRQLVERREKSGVRFLEVSQISHKLVGDGLNAATPDGFHYSPELHREVGRELARAIEEWAQGQPHLTTASADSTPSRTNVAPVVQKPAAAR